LKNLFTTEYKPGDKVLDQFVLKRKEIRNTKSGSLFLSLNFSDREGELSAKKWETTQIEFDNLEEGKVYEVSGECDSYQGKIQLVVYSMKKINDLEIRVEDFLPQSQFSFEELKKRILEVLESIKDEDYSKILKFIFDDKNLEKFCKFPAGKILHHSTIGGLAEHVLSLVESAEFYAKKYKILNRDLLISGTLMHDFAKIFEYQISTSFEFTTIGKLSGHISIGFAKILEAGKYVEANEEKTFLLGHMVLSHHGTPEFGSPIKPQIPESFVLMHIDDLDFQINMCESLLKENLTDGWTEWIRALDRKLYLGNSNSNFKNKIFSSENQEKNSKLETLKIKKNDEEDKLNSLFNI